MIQGHQREGAKSPEDEGVGEAGQRPLADHFGLEQHFPEEIPDAFAEWRERESPGSGLASRILRTTLPKRRQNPSPRTRARTSAGKRLFRRGKRPLVHPAL